MIETDVKSRYRAVVAFVSSTKRLDRLLKSERLCSGHPVERQATVRIHRSFVYA